MMARSTAEQYRIHRAAFALALELGCTPREAEAELRRRSAWQHLQETKQRATAQAAPQPVARMAVNPEPAPEPWWKKD